MKAYEDRLYEEWRIRVERILPNLLKKNLLVKLSDKTTQGVVERGLTLHPTSSEGLLDGNSKINIIYINILLKNY